MSALDWILLIGAGVVLVSLLAVLRPRSGQSTSPFGPFLSNRGRPPDYINTVRTLEQEAKDMADDTPPKDLAP